MEWESRGPRPGFPIDGFRHTPVCTARNRSWVENPRLPDVDYRVRREGNPGSPSAKRTGDLSPPSEVRPHPAS